MLTSKQKKHIKSLLSQMTIEEKIGQLNHVAPTVIGAFDVDAMYAKLQSGEISCEQWDALCATATPYKREDMIKKGLVSSYAVVGRQETLRLQKIAVEQSRLGIPIIFSRDVIHGYRTGTPTPLAESCAWNPSLWKQTARMAAQEATSDGVTMTYSPMVDVAKDARWGRIAECAGEDTLLNAMYGKAKVEGYQNGDPSQPSSLAACAKHFAAYGFVEGGRDYNRVQISEERLREEVLPSFKACVDAGVLAIMPSFNDINGIPASVNKWLLTDVLRTEWGFGGLTISDSGAIGECVAHGVCADKKDAAKQALVAGMDMDMSSDSYIAHLKELVESGELDIEYIDRAVENVLRVKAEMGLFDDPYRLSLADENPFGKDEYRQLAKFAAIQSMVLLENDGVLPLKQTDKVAIVGKYADNNEIIKGTWSLDVRNDECVSIASGLVAKNRNCKLFADVNDAAKSDADVVVVVLGEWYLDSGEAASKTDITFSADQQSDLVVALNSGKKVVALLVNGRPMVLGEATKANAVVECWQCGVESGNAVADLLYGDADFSAKLTVTIPNATGECPCYYDRPATGRPASSFYFTSKYIDCSYEHKYCFGYGLSYTQFVYSDIAASKTNDAFVVSAKVTNVGNKSGREIVQCYYGDPVASRTRPVKKLVDFCSVTLASDESQTVSFKVPFDKLGFFVGSKYVVEQGDFVLSIGGNSNSLLQIKVKL